MNDMLCCAGTDTGNGRKKTNTRVAVCVNLREIALKEVSSPIVFAYIEEGSLLSSTSILVAKLKYTHFFNTVPPVSVSFGLSKGSLMNPWFV